MCGNLPTSSCREKTCFAAGFGVFVLIAFGLGDMAFSCIGDVPQRRSMLLVGMQMPQLWCYDSSVGLLSASSTDFRGRLRRSHRDGEIVSGDKGF